MEALVLGLLLAFSAHAFEIKSEIKSQGLEIKVRDIPLVETDLRKQLKSGLTTTLVMQLAGHSQAGATLRRLRTFWIVYDLWEEVYQVKIFEESKIEKFNSKDVNEILNRLRHQSFLIERPKESFDVRLLVTLNPISKEKMQKIRRWLAQNNVNLPSAPQTSQSNVGANGQPVKLAPNASATISGEPAGASPIAAARFSGVLAQVLDSELDAPVSGVWSFASPPLSVRGGGE